MKVNIDKGAQANTIALNRFKKMFPHMVNDQDKLIKHAVTSTERTWVSHDWSPQQFIGQFITHTQHANDHKSYPTHFYVFKHTTVLLSYAASDYCLGI